MPNWSTCNVKKPRRRKKSASDLARRPKALRRAVPPSHERAQRASDEGQKNLVTTKNLKNPLPTAAALQHKAVRRRSGTEPTRY